MVLGGFVCESLVQMLPQAIIVPAMSNADALRPMCFVAMPFGARTAKRGMKVDF
jgi:hypothetical protein